MSRIIAIDFETFFDTEEGIDIKTLGAAGYIRDPRVDCYLISVSDGAETWAGHPRDFNFESLRGATLIAHNFGFDSAVLRELMKRGVAPTFDFSGHCSAALSTYLCMRRDLLRATEFLLGVKVDKSYRLDADGKSWDDMVSAGVSDKVKEAGRVDALRCWQIWTKFSGLWPERERKLSDLTIRQGQRGVQIDVPNLERQIIVAQKAMIEAESNLPWVAEGRPKTSPKAIAERCRAEGIPAPPVKSHAGGEEAFEAWETAYKPRFPWVKAVADWRQINKYLGQLETIKGRLFDDGILPFDLLYFGAHTGRWSGAGGLNLQNLRKAPLVVEGGSLDIRTLFIPRPGKRMVAGDLSQIEPRVLAYLAGDKKMLASMAAGESPYSAHAIATMGWTGGNLKTENKELYALAKARVLGLGYGCGHKKFVTVAMAMAGLDITVGDPEWTPALNDEGQPCLDAAEKPIMVSGLGMNSRRIVKEFRESNPLIVGLWKRLDDAFKASVGGDFELELPSGRVLRYPQVMRERKAVADVDRPGKWIHKLVYTALAFDQTRNSVIRKPFYGGLLCENLVQACSRDIFGEHLIALSEMPGVDVLWSVHDEAICEVDKHVEVKDVERAMSRAPSWMPGLPVAAEVAEIPCYTK